MVMKDKLNTIRKFFYKLYKSRNLFWVVEVVWKVENYSLLNIYLFNK